MSFDRAELEEMKQRWLDANVEAEKAGDWKPLADFYTEDATYGWNYGKDQDFMAVGRDEIRDLVTTALPGIDVTPAALPANLALPAGTAPAAVTFARDWTVVVTDGGEILLFARDGSLARRVPPE